MSACDRSACCLELPDKEDLAGIIGVGVLLRSVSDPLSDRGSGLFCEDVRFVLNSRSKEVKKPLMNLVGSVVLVADNKVGIGQQSRCVRVKFWRLKPYVARFLSENCLNKLKDMFKEKESSYCQKQHSSTAKRVFEVWYLAGDDSLWCDENLNDAAEDEGSDLSISETAAGTSDRESGSVKFECEIRYSCAEDCDCDLKVVDLWAEARSVARKISMLQNESIKHFGYLVPADEIGWVKAGYYRSLPKAYKKKFKKKRKKISKQYFADYLEEKARKNVGFRFWWHPMSRFLIFLVILIIAIRSFNIGSDILTEFLENESDNLAIVIAGLVALAGVLVLLVLLLWRISKSINLCFFRKRVDKSRRRRLKKWQNGNE